MIILWFRQDLRLEDNPALCAAVEQGRILPVYILDDVNAGRFAMGGASRWWLHHSLSALQRDLQGHLRFFKGDASEILSGLMKKTGAQGVYWNRCYEPWRIARDKAIKTALKEQGADARSFNGSLLWEPHEVLKEDGTPYKVFTPFYRRGCLERAGEPRVPVERSERIDYADYGGGVDLDALGLMPEIDWYSGMAAEWTPGEAGAQTRLTDFVEHGLRGYKEKRNRPDLQNVSRLSPHLHFGEISPHTAWHTAWKAEAVQGLKSDGDVFRSELGWREFSHTLLYHFPELPQENWQKKFDTFPWLKDYGALECWQRGMTGYPIVDAGMRELWQTGYMHNRVRMVVASFLVKHLMLHWQHGERWFWDTLVDADLANNSASWQWVAGCGADAAPYFRIFNPITQGDKFDPKGEYTRRFVPELAQMPDKYLFCPWEAPKAVLEQAGVVLGETYPQPIVDHKKARERALGAFSDIG
jgi:deoxyribodipyrimidine photo-lyase